MILESTQEVRFDDILAAPTNDSEPDHRADVMDASRDQI
jgi:hypothetical protein